MISHYEKLRTLVVESKGVKHEFELSIDGGRHKITVNGKSSTHFMVPTETMLVKIILGDKEN